MAEAIRTYGYADYPERYAELAFDALLKEIPCRKDGYTNQNSLWLQKLKAMERKSAPST